MVISILLDAKNMIVECEDAAASHLGGNSSQNTIHGEPSKKAVNWTRLRLCVCWVNNTPD
jgi:hypothetical protein